MVRNIFAFLIFAPFIIKNGLQIFRTKKLHLHIARSVNGLVGMAMWFYVVTLIALPEAVSLTFTVPIITTIAAIIFLKEKVSYRIWLSLLFGFVGVLIIAKPGVGEFHFAYLLAILATFFWSITNILVKIMTKTEHPDTILAYLALIMMLISLPLVFVYYQKMSMIDVLWFALMGMVSNMSHLFLSKAYLRVDLSAVQPFDFTRLIFISIIAYFAFGEVVGLHTVAGSLLIMSGSLYLTPRRKKVVNLEKEFESKI